MNNNIRKIRFNLILDWGEYETNTTKAVREAIAVSDAKGISYNILGSTTNGKVKIIEIELLINIKVWPEYAVDAEEPICDDLAFEDAITIKTLKTSYEIRNVQVQEPDNASDNT